MKSRFQSFIKHFLSLMDFGPGRVNEQVQKYSSKNNSLDELNNDWKKVLTGLNLILWNMEEKLEISESLQTQKPSQNTVE